MQPGPVHKIERNKRVATAHLRGDLTVATARRLHHALHGLTRRRDVRHVVVDFTQVARMDSAGVAVLALLERDLGRAGKQLDLTGQSEHHQMAMAVLRSAAPASGGPEPKLERGRLLEPLFERVGDRVVSGCASARSLSRVIAETTRQGLSAVTRRHHIRSGSISEQIALMGTNAVMLVCLLAFLLGMTTAFQGAVQLERVGAGVFVADMVALSVVREFAPLVTAVILSGRTGAAIAAELGTMRVRGEIDALAAMGISPARFLVLPRMVAIMVTVPGLTLMATAAGILGGVMVTGMALDMTPTAFWARTVERLDILDFLHGLGKSLVFAWIIGFAGAFYGLRASNDPSSVGAATTRTVVASIFMIIVVDAAFATVSTYLRLA